MDYNNEEFNNRDDYCSKWAWTTRWTTLRRRSGTWGNLPAPFTNVKEIFTSLLHLKLQWERHLSG